MNQNINLYLPEFRKKRTWLDAAGMFRITAVVLFIVALISAWQIRLQRERQQILLEAETEYQQLSDQVAALEAEAASLAATRDLETAIESLQSQLRDKQLLLNFLEGRELGNVTGFSEYLADLSRYHTPGLSLSGIVLRGGGAQVELSGQVLEAELVPLYLQSLRQGQAYVGKNFQTLMIGDEAQQAGAAGGSELAQARTYWEFSVATGTAAAGE